MICPNCGTSVEGSVCPCCGTVLSQGAQTTLLSETNNPFLNQTQPPQAYDPSQGQYAPQGYAPNQGQYAPQGYAPNQGQYAPQGYAPNQGQYAPQGYAPNQGYTQPGGPAYVPQSYAQPQAQGFAVPGQAAPYVPQGAQGPSYAVGQEPPAVQAVRKLAASPLFLLGALALSAQLVLWVLYNLGRFSSLRELAASLGLDPSGVQPELVPVLLLGLATLLFGLLVYSVWSVYATALHRGHRRMSTSGLTTIGVMATALLWLSLAALAVAFLYFLYLALRFGLSPAVEMASALVYAYGLGALSELLGIQGFDFLLILYAAASALVIVLFASLVKTVNTGKAVITTGSPDGRGALTAGILCFLLAAASVWLALAPLRERLLLPALLALTGALSQLLFGILLLCYRFAMSRVKAYNV